MTITSSIGLGGAQFGLDYGITNNRRVAADEVTRILALSRSRGVQFLDTAADYGASEEAIGQADPAGMRVISKTPRLPDDANALEAAAIIEAAACGSLARLGIAALDGLIVHDAGALLGPRGAAIWRELERLKARGVAKRIGVSVYRGDEIDAVLSRFPIDLIQLPFNAVDRRLEQGGQLDRLVSAGVAIHVRSVFLQGLLLAEPRQIPAQLSPIRAAVEHLRDWSRGHGQSLLETCLQAVLGRPGIECCLIGVTSTGELKAALDAEESIRNWSGRANFRPAEHLSEHYLDPSQWPRSAAYPQGKT